MASRVLYLLRHAAAETHALHDVERHLTVNGRDEADGVARYLASQGTTIDETLCSPAARTRETAERLGLEHEPDLMPALYHSGSEVVRSAISCVDADTSCVLVVGHAPGIPALVHDLADRATSAPDALAAIASQYPTATCARLEFEGAWMDLIDGRTNCARLTSVHLARTAVPA